MAFHNASAVPRPVRLSEAARAFAARSLDGVYGREARANHAVSLDDIPDFDLLSPQKRYDAAIRRVCEAAPLRLVPEELVCGAATLGLGIRHQVPATYHGQVVCESISHYTADFPDALRRGVDAIEAELLERLRDPALTELQREVLEGMRNAVDALHIYHARYMAALRADGSPRCLAIAAALERVPFQPPQTFREAVQIGRAHV